MVIFSILYLQIQNTHDQNSKRSKRSFWKINYCNSVGSNGKKKHGFIFSCIYKCSSKTFLTSVT